MHPPPGPDAPPPEAPEERALWAMLVGDEAARRRQDDRAQAHFAMAEQAIAALPPHGVAQLLTQARLELTYARQAVRRGDAEALARHLQRAMARLRPVSNPRDTTRLALSEAQAIAAILAGAHDRAARHLKGAAELAERAGDPWVARIQRIHGAIHARFGRPLLAARAYRAAIDRLREEDAPLEVAKLSSNLAMVSLMAGEAEAAEHAIDRALRLRVAHSAPPADLANSTAVRALVRERRACADAPAVWREAVELTRRSPDAVLTAEIELRAAIASVERGELDEAAALHALATERVTQVGRLEPTIAAMAAEATSRLHLAHGRLADAARDAARARAGYTSLDALYHVARVDLLEARIHDALGAEPEAMACADRACGLALRGPFELAWRPLELALLRRAAESGHRHARRYCRQAGVEVDGRDAVLILDAVGGVEKGGILHELGATSIPFRLVRMLAAAPERAHPSAELCRRLWRGEADAPQERLLKRLKVHIHNLRDLLDGPSCILTETLTRRDGATTAYRWNPDLPVRVVRRPTRPPR